MRDVGNWWVSTKLEWRGNCPPGEGQLDQYHYFFFVLNKHNGGNIIVIDV